MNREPLITVGAISLIVSALLTLLVSFGLEITNEQIEAIMQFVAAASPLVVGYLVARQKAYSPKTTHEAYQTGLRQGERVAKGLPPDAPDDLYLK